VQGKGVWALNGGGGDDVREVWGGGGGWERGSQGLKNEYNLLQKRGGLVSGREFEDDVEG